MNSEPGKKNVATGKAVSIAALYVLSVLIILAGAVFSVKSLLTGFSFSVFSSQVPGVAFGLVVLFLGVRYFFSVSKLKAEVYRSDSAFSWSNFMRPKKLNRK